jgi:hypothetical protein
VAFASGTNEASIDNAMDPVIKRFIFLRQFMEDSSMATQAHRIAARSQGVA